MRRGHALVAKVVNITTKTEGEKTWKTEFVRGRRGGVNMEEIDRSCDSVWLPLQSGSEEEDGEGSGRCDGGKDWVAGHCLGPPHCEVQLEE
jgi:hypothetical protein